MKQIRMIVNIQLIASAIYGFLIGCTEEATLAENVAGILLIFCAVLVLLERAAVNEELKNRE